MIRVSIPSTGLKAEADSDAGAPALAVDFVFSGREFADHVYYLSLADSSGERVSAVVALTRGADGALLYGSLSTASTDIADLLENATSVGLVGWVEDATEQEWLCWFPLTVRSAPDNTGTTPQDTIPCTSLPTGSSIVAGQVYRLTVKDDTAKAAPGIYVHDGTAWYCIANSAAYAIGNLGSGFTFPDIFGLVYTATLDQACAITMPNVAGAGTISLRLTNGGAYTITWDSDIEWASGCAAYLTPSGVDWLIFITHDGTTWTGSVSETDVS